MNLDLAPADWRHEAATWSEEQLKRTVLSDCNLLRLDVKWDKHPRLSTVKGWPDLVIIGPGGILYRELKSMFGFLSVPQRAVGSRLAKAGHDWQVWRPVEWYDGTIESQLLKIAARFGRALDRDEAEHSAVPVHDDLISLRIVPHVHSGEPPQPELVDKLPRDPHYRAVTLPGHLGLILRFVGLGALGALGGLGGGGGLGGRGGLGRGRGGRGRGGRGRFPGGLRHSPHSGQRVNEGMPEAPGIAARDRDHVP